MRCPDFKGRKSRTGTACPDYWGVLISEVTWFRGLQMLSYLLRCPHFRTCVLENSAVIAVQHFKYVIHSNIHLHVTLKFHLSSTLPEYLIFSWGAPLLVPPRPPPANVCDVHVTYTCTHCIWKYISLQWMTNWMYIVQDRRSKKKGNNTINWNSLILKCVIM